MYIIGAYTIQCIQDYAANVCYSDSLTCDTLYYCPFGVGWDGVSFIVDTSDVGDECAVTSREGSAVKNSCLHGFLPALLLHFHVSPCIVQ